VLRRLDLFGPMCVELERRTVDVPRGDAQRLLGYLALHPGRRHRREVLAGTLWDGAAERSRRSLSDTLYRLRKQLGDGWLAVDVDTVAMAADVSVDVWDFDRLIVSDDVDELDAAVNLHLGDLCPGLYDDWALEHRAARHASLVTALGRLAAAREQAGDLQHAVHDARRLILVEPFNESAQQTYLRLLGRLGRYGEAVAHYDSFRQTLADELDVAPLAATTELVRQLTRERDVTTAHAVEDRSRFVGRIAERSTALRAVEAAFDGHGSVVCVEGPAGIGKTRLVAEIQQSARWRGATILVGDVRDVPEASPLAPLARAFGPLLSAPLRMQIESALDTATLRMLGPLHPDWLPAEPGPPPRDGAMRLQRALRVLGETAAGMGTVVLVLDDLHWGGPALWDGIAALVEGFVAAGGLLVASYRRPEIEATAGWQVLQDWDRRGLATFMRLEPFGLADVAELLDDDEDPAGVLALTGGVPFYVAQWIQGASGGQRMDGSTLIRQRLEALDPAPRRALDGAAVLGESIPFDVWLDVSDTSVIELAVTSEHLVAERWITPTATGHAFTHDLLRAAVYERISTADRRSLHERSAESLSRREPQNARTRAYHLDRAGLGLPAAAAYTEAGRSRRAEASFTDALETWGRALELLPRRARRERLALALDFAEVCDIVGGHAELRTVLNEATESARRLHDDESLLRAMLLAGGMAVRAGDVDDGRRTLDEARQLAERLGDRRSLADASFRHADLLVQTGHWPEGDEQFQAALDLVDPEQDPWLHGRALRGRALCALRMGHPTEALRWQEEALAAYRAAGDRLNELVTAAHLLGAYYETGSWDQLVETAEPTLALARQLGDPVCAGIALQGLGFGAQAVGDRAAARAMLADAEASWKPTGRRRLVGAAINSRGLVAADDGDHDEAIALYTSALEIFRETDAATEEAYVSHDLGALLHEIGRVDEAIPLLRMSATHWADAGNAMLQAKSEAVLGLALLATGEESAEAADLAESGITLFRSGVPLGEHPQAWLWSLSQLLRRLGRHADADDVLDAARRELVRQASSIADPERRRGFFERVPLNRQIMDEGRSAASPVLVVHLAGVEAPLGRALRPDELVEVRWTPSLPTDDAIADPADRRRHRLQRLLDEAASHGAAPTDDDLAAALGVSRRTILRDMAALGDAPSRGVTRRRARQHRVGL
jgi:DNA-binding SARP family transcriptional activator